jgi:hypothetical protein
MRDITERYKEVRILDVSCCISYWSFWDDVISWAARHIKQLEWGRFIEKRRKMIRDDLYDLQGRCIANGAYPRNYGGVTFWNNRDTDIPKWAKRHVEFAKEMGKEERWQKFHYESLASRTTEISLISLYLGPCVRSLARCSDLWNPIFLERHYVQYRRNTDKMVLFWMKKWHHAASEVVQEWMEKHVSKQRKKTFLCSCGCCHEEKRGFDKFLEKRKEEIVRDRRYVTSIRLGKNKTDMLILRYAIDDINKSRVEMLKDPAKKRIKLR